MLFPALLVFLETHVRRVLPLLWVCFTLLQFERTHVMVSFSLAFVENARAEILFSKIFFALDVALTILLLFRELHLWPLLWFLAFAKFTAGVTIPRIAAERFPVLILVALRLFPWTIHRMRSP